MGKKELSAIGAILGIILIGLTLVKNKSQWFVMIGFPIFIISLYIFCINIKDKEDSLTP